MDIEIKKLESDDIGLFLNLISVFKEVFEWHSLPPGPLHLQKVLNNNCFIVFIAISGNLVVGGLTAYVLERYDTEKPSAYIYDLAVIKEMQRNGVGKKLITAFTTYCNENDFSEAFVQAEIEDSHAINFYRNTVVSSELQAIHFTYSFETGKV